MSRVAVARALCDGGRRTCSKRDYLHEQDYARRIARPLPEPPDRDGWLKQPEDFVPKLMELLQDESVEVFSAMK